MVDAFEPTQAHVDAMKPAFTMMGAKIFAIEDEEIRKKLLAPKSAEEDAVRLNHFNEHKAGAFMTKAEFFKWQHSVAEHGKEKYGAGLFFTEEESQQLYDIINAVTPENDGVSWDDMEVKMRKIHVKKKELEAAQQ